MANMDFLRSQLLRVQQQVGELSASQKMLTATLVTIMVMTLVLWTNYSSKSEMEPLLDQSLTQEDITKIRDHLSARQIKYSVVGDRVLVPSDRRSEIIADLGYSKLLPRNTSAAFDSEAYKQLTAFTPDSQRKVFFNKSKENQLSSIISNLPGVASATVIIDPTEERRFAPNPRQSTAMVSIETKTPDQRPNKKLINSAADLIAGAQSGLDRSKIRVVIDGASYPVQEYDDGALVATEFVEKKQEAERFEARRIQELLEDIPDVKVAVTVTLNTQEMHRQEQRVDPNEIIYKEKSIRERTSENTSAPMGAMEPGSLANIGVSINEDAGAVAPDSSTENENEVEFELLHSRITQESTIPAGEHKVVAATVRVPRSHFVNIVKLQNPSTTEVNDSTLQPVIMAGLNDIRAAVKKCTALANDEDVDVQVYYDMMPSLAMAPAAPVSGISSMVSGYTKEIAVGALAVVSLFMVLMMVRKGSPAPIIPVRPEPKPTPQLMATEALAGEATEGNAMLDGMELDEDAVKTQQMLEQVTTMVDENPDAAANLVKRWLNRS
jgi:flagellar biosynthesis/type III secretory pathway M-ring protein FliF/YscJ